MLCCTDCLKFPLSRGHDFQSLGTDRRMSKTFDVYPRIRRLPSFGELIERSTMELHRFLDSVGIPARPRIHVRLQSHDDHAHLPLALRDPLSWKPSTYAWFMVGDVAGGTDAYFEADGESIRETWDGPFADPKCVRIDSVIRECVGVGHYWSFRRSAGQTGIVSLAYGLIAGSLAAITDGFIYSVDSAWDWERMPARPEDFLKFYFRPELAIDEGCREWSQRCIEGFAEDLRDVDGALD